MFPEAPGRFSTTIGCPNPSAIFWATKRAELSVAPPGGNPRTRRIGRCGNSRPCAPARAGTQPPAASRRERRESCEAMQGSDATQCEEKHPVNRFIMEAIVGYESFHRIRVYSGQAPTPALWRTVRIRQRQAALALPTTHKWRPHGQETAKPRHRQEKGQGPVRQHRQKLGPADLAGGPGRFLQGAARRWQSI